MCILCNNYGKKLAYLKPPASVQRPRVRRYGLKPLLCIFRNSSDVFHNRLEEMSLVATPYVKYHKLTKVANKYCSHYDNTLENCASLEDNARKHTANQRHQNYFPTLNCCTCCRSSYRSNTASNDVHSYRSLQRFLAEKC